VLNKSVDAISKYTENGRNYAKDFSGLQFEIRSLMNYLDGIAIGVNWGFYDRDIVFRHFQHVIHKNVAALLKGVCGEAAGRSWVSAEPATEAKGYECLEMFYHDWFGLEDKDKKCPEGEKCGDNCRRKAKSRGNGIERPKSGARSWGI
jgi:hypothetical protein